MCIRDSLSTVKRITRRHQITLQTRGSGTRWLAREVKPSPETISHNAVRQLILWYSRKSARAPPRHSQARAPNCGGKAAATDDVDGLSHHGDWAARCPAVVPAILPNTEPFIRPVPPG